MKGWEINTLKMDVNAVMFPAVCQKIYLLNPFCHKIRSITEQYTIILLNP